MPESSENAPKQPKPRKLTPEQRQASLRYNQMFYGPTERERQFAPKKVDYGASYLQHPKFQTLVKAFRNGTAFQFEVSAGGKTFTIATDGSEITCNGRMLCYGRALNRFEDNLLLNRATALQFQDAEPVVHLVFALLRSFPELEEQRLTFGRRQFQYDGVDLDEVPEREGQNLLLGSFRHTKFRERSKG